MSDNGSADQAQSQGYQQCSMVVPAQGVVVPTVPYRSSTIAADSWTQQLQVESTTRSWPWYIWCLIMQANCYRSQHPTTILHPDRPHKAGLHRRS